jgi:D-serine deaminase-like pyridoxal phosphate-dependent protein
MMGVWPLTAQPAGSVGGVRLADRILLHGNGKTRQELSVALDYGVGRVVVDSAGEAGQLAALAALAGRRQKVLVRVTPGVDAHVHPAVTTGTEDQKFGLSIASGEAARVARRILREPSLELAGAHCHIGSQISSLEGFDGQAFGLGFLTFLRVAVVVAVSSVIWVPVGVWIGFNPRVAVMAVYVTGLNALLWRRLYSIAESKYALA